MSHKENPKKKFSNFVIIIKSLINGTQQKVQVKKLKMK